MGFFDQKYACRNSAGSRWNVACLAFLILFGAMVPVVACAVTEVNTPDELRKLWGIEITSVRLAVAGHMVDFRYRVLDANKAATLFVRKNKPFLLDQASGQVLAVPNLGKVGRVRASNKPKSGRIYWMFFANAGGLVQVGNKVTVTIGDFKVRDIVVQ